MIGETRAQVLERVGVQRSDKEREMVRKLIAIFFQMVLGDDDSRVMTEEDRHAVEAAMQAERNRLAVEAGYSCIEELEAAQ